MAARDQQQKERKVDVLGQTRRQGMAFEMVDRDQGQVTRQGKALGKAQAHHDAADQARAGGGGDGI